MKKYFIILFCLMLAAPLFAQKKGRFKISYLSSEKVYLDGGKSRGLQVGDRLYIVRQKKRVIGEIKVVFTATHSASCDIISAKEKLSRGDLAILVERKETAGEQKTPEPATQAPQKKAEPAPEEKAPQPQRVSKPRREKSRRGISRFSGNVAVQYFRLNDLSAGNLDFSQPTLRLNLRGQNLWGKDYRLRIRTRTRYNQRSRAYNANIPRDEWRNRIYQFSFGYSNPAAPFNFTVGRLISNFMSGIGYIDGLQLQTNLNRSFRFGVVAGAAPDWRNSNFQTQVKKYGAYLNLNTGSFQTREFRSTLAWAAEYNGATISREFIYIQNNYTAGTRFSVYHSTELDINRKWRKSRTGESISLSNLFLSARYQFTRAVRVGLTFDNRKNYWTYEVRSLADSLFDDALRLGLRGNISFKLPSQMYVFINGGMRKRETDAKTASSYSARFRKGAFLWRSLAFSANYAAFDNRFTNGHTANIQLSKSYRSGHRLELAYGLYNYNFDQTSRNNEWVRGTLYMALFRRMFLSHQFEYSWGDDLDGQRIYVELGYRF